MFSCGFFAEVNNCGERNFLNLMGWAFGQPVLALLALRQARLWATIGAVSWLCLVGGMLMTAENAPVLFARNMVNCEFSVRSSVDSQLHCSILSLSPLLFSRKGVIDRCLPYANSSRYSIGTPCGSCWANDDSATQSAQVMERRAADSKKRFVSYSELRGPILLIIPVFHEVRVPLNTALLAVQNLDGEEVFKGLHEDQSEMVHGLMGSLTMMEKVLNDVLSFNRMESGKVCSF